MPALRTDAYLAPRYLVSVEGTKLQSDVTDLIDSVTYEEGENVASKIVLDVLNPDFKLLESKVFAEGNAVDLWVGYDAKPLKFMNRGFVQKPNPTFPRGGIPRIRVVAHDVSRKLMDAGEKDKGKTYSKKRDSEIVEALFKEIEVAPFVVQTKGLKTRTRKKGTPRWQFMKRIARLNGYVLDVRYDPTKRLHVGFFGPAEGETQEDIYKFSYGTGEADATLLEFTPDTSLPSQDTKLEVTYTDPKTRKTHRVEVEVTRKDAERTKFTGTDGAKELKREITNGPSVTLTVFGQQEEVVADRQFTSPKDAKRWASAWWDRRQREFSFGRGSVLGVNTLRRGQVHELKGLGNRLSGKWQFTSVVHRQSGRSLYEVEFTATKVVLSSLVSTPGNVANVKGRVTKL
jgi:phage protein D